MTLFTDNPLERMMIQKPGDGRRGKSPPASIPPRCKGCPYNREPPCVGYCMEGEMRDFAARTLAKVRRMTEAEFAELAVYPADEV